MLRLDHLPVIGDSSPNCRATGGDGFSVFAQCTNLLGGEIDIDVLVSAFENNSPIAPGLQNRITRLP